MDQSNVLERRRMLAQELERFLVLLGTRSDVERVIVFGSYLTGEIHAWSDLDLVIIQQTNSPFLHRLHQMRNLLRPRVGIDLLVYTPTEFEQLVRERAFVRDEILEKGKVIYERGKPLAHVRA